MAKATEDELSALHGAVARVLREQLEEKAVITDSDTGEEREVSMATPAMIAAATKFLKDNNVTASIEDDENLSELQDQLEKNRKKRKLRLASGGEE